MLPSGRHKPQIVWRVEAEAKPVGEMAGNEYMYRTRYGSQ